MTSKLASRITGVSAFLAIIMAVFACDKDTLGTLYALVNTAVMPFSVSLAYEIRKSTTCALLAYASFIIIDILFFNADASILVWSILFAVLCAVMHEEWEKKRNAEMKEYIFEPQRPYVGMKKYDIVVKYSTQIIGGEIFYPKEITNENNSNLTLEYEGIIINVEEYVREMLNLGESHKLFSIHHIICEDGKRKEKDVYLDITVTKI